MKKSFEFIKAPHSDNSSTTANIFIHGYSAGHNESDRNKLLERIPDFLSCHTNIFAFWDSSHYINFDTYSLLLINASARLHPAAFIPITIGDRVIHFRNFRAKSEVIGKRLLSELTEFIHEEKLSINTINLIGHSLGGRLAVHCLKSVTDNPDSQLIINDVLLMAAAVEVQPGEAQSMRDQLRGGRIFNAYSKSDMVLLANFGETCIGRNPVDHFENIEIEGLGHTDYWQNLSEVLSKTIFKKENQLVALPEKDYSEEKLWEKLKIFSAKAGSEVVGKAIQLYYASKATGTPTAIKATIYSALGYFIMPVDVIPDVTPALGFSDDLAILAAAVSAASAHINKEVTQKSTKKISEWFG
jgi:uncharacterized membrane protein YkvA (DUF1232 family)